MWSPGWDAEAKRFASLLNRCFSVAVTTHDRFNSFKLRPISSSAHIHFFSNLTRFTRFLPPTNLRTWRILICGYVKGFHYIFKSRVLFPCYQVQLAQFFPHALHHNRRQLHHCRLPPSITTTTAQVSFQRRHTTNEILYFCLLHLKNSGTVLPPSDYCCYRVSILAPIVFSLFDVVDFFGCAAFNHSIRSNLTCINKEKRQNLEGLYRGSLYRALVLMIATMSKGMNELVSSKMQISLPINVLR
ncbi:hypothetical protein LXL04_008506 [Taraxacum kok-saghyz]